MFNCDKPYTSKSAAAAVTVAADRITKIDMAQMKKALSSISYVMFVCGGITLGISAFLDPKDMIIPTIIGYGFIIVGIAFSAAYVLKFVMMDPSNASVMTKMESARVGMVFFSLILIVLITLRIYSKYKTEIKNGHVPQFATFSLLISIFICMQLYELYKWMNMNDNSTSGVIKVTSTMSSKLLFYKLINYLLIICLVIILKYYMTDG